MVLRKEPRTFPWTRLDLATKECIVGMRIIWQESLLHMLHARAHGFYGDWQDTDVQEEDVTWITDNRYLVNLPEPGTEDIRKKKYHLKKLAGVSLVCWAHCNRGAKQPHVPIPGRRFLLDVRISGIVSLFT